MSKNTLKECEVAIKTYNIDTLDISEYINILSVTKLNLSPQEILIENAKIVDAESNLIIHDKSVFIRNNIIAAIGNQDEIRKSLTTTNCITVIDAKGQYLSPGLADMHVHYSCGAFERLHFLSNGVTTVRHVNSEYIHFKEDSMINNNKIIGPQFYLTSPHITSSEKNLKRIQGSDWILFYSPDSAQILFDWYEKTQHVVSIDGWREFYRIEYPPGTIFEQMFYPLYPFSLSNADTYWRMWKLFYMKINHPSGLIPFGTVEVQQSIDELSQRLGQYCFGTEAGSYNFNLNGYKTTGDFIHKEMQYLQQLKFSPHFIIQIATINAGRMIMDSRMGDDHSFTSADLPFGKINVGYRADMVLLSDNPLEDVAHYKKIQGVFSRGIWFDRNDLDNIKYFIDNYNETEYLHPYD